jgi:hypothetical protein
VVGSFALEGESEGGGHRLEDVAGVLSEFRGEGVIVPVEDHPLLGEDAEEPRGDELREELGLAVTDRKLN